eukprot:TRINITY_DN6254_c0_g1_i1.p1 TRINITY_DN6254_c0_g1~~TRINITY_DN6254_c0_g1_i1.p1  ORF type:complete len:279 (+),score=36.09 TRINITY_DN6254_c0_g1_i1:101-937(+)
MSGNDYAQLGLQDTDDLNAMLVYQAQALWSQELVVFGKCVSESAKELKVLEVGTGTGEFSIRIARQFPNIRVTGIDLEDRNISFAKKRLEKEDDPLRSRITFQTGNIFDLKDFADESFDIVSCRSTLPAIEHADKALAQLARVAKKGGYLHLLNEDYGLCYSYPSDSEKLWAATRQYFYKDKANPLIGRASFTLVKTVIPQAKDIQITYGQADTVRVSRDIIAKIFKSWRDGYSEAVAKANEGVTTEQVRSWFDELIKTTESPTGYSCWQVVFCTVKV